MKLAEQLLKSYRPIKEDEEITGLPKYQKAMSKAEHKPAAKKAEIYKNALQSLVAMAWDKPGMKPLLKEWSELFAETVSTGKVDSPASGNGSKEKEFIEYFRSFYDPKHSDALYPNMIKPGWGDKDILDGIKKRGSDFEGDSMDREYIRDMLIKKFGDGEK